MKFLHILTRSSLLHSFAQVFYDPNGGLYSKRQALKFTGDPVDSGIAALSKPGYKVLHIQDLDFESTCLTLKSCLQQMYAWSQKNPRHFPITVKLVASFRTIEEMAGPAAAALLKGAAVPLPVTTQSLKDLEKEILQVIPRSKIVIPDDIRGKHSSLVAAVARKGWPTVSQLAGKFMFVLNPDSACETYRSDAPTLQGKLMFTAPSTIGTPDAAIVAMEPLSSISAPAINSLLKKNILVWARTDEDTQQARQSNYTLRTLVVFAGAQIVHTDYPSIEAPNPFGTKYMLGLPGNMVARCNPKIAPQGCSNTLLMEPIK